MLDFEEEICGSCNGSGEGFMDGTRCHTCGGSGVVFVDETGHIIKRKGFYDYE